MKHNLVFMGTGLVNPGEVQIIEMAKLPQDSIKVGETVEIPETLLVQFAEDKLSQLERTVDFAKYYNCLFNVSPDGRTVRYCAKTIQFTATKVVKRIQFNDLAGELEINADILLTPVTPA